MRSRWLAYCLSTIRIILIQQPEPPGSEAVESRVRNRGREILPTKHLTNILWGSFTYRNLRQDQRLYFSSEGSARYGSGFKILPHSIPDIYPDLLDGCLWNIKDNLGRISWAGNADDFGFKER
jgi:hypothetical protein